MNTVADQETEKIDQQTEVDRNYESFREKLPDLLKTDANRFALMRRREVVACFDTSRDALEAGSKLYKDGRFSVQEITNRTVDLGYFSRAGILRTV